MISLYFDLTFHPASGREAMTEERGGRDYRITAENADGSTAAELISISLGELARYERTLHTPDEPAPDSETRTEQDAVDLGTILFESAFQGSVRDLFFQTYGQAKAEGELLRLRLRFPDEVPELAALSWEYLYWQARRRFWALSGEISIVRYLEIPDQHRSLLGNLPLRLLMISASPANAPLKVVDHQQALESAFAELRPECLVEPDFLKEVDSGPLAEALGSAAFDVLHVVAHGKFDADTNQGSLIFQDLLRRERPMADRRLATLLNQYPPRLVVLAACEGAEGSTDSLFDGVAQQLVLQGIPAVIAMRSPVRECDAIQLTRELYTALAQGESLDRALISARIRIEHPTAWGIPALFSRSAEARLFELPRHFGHPFKRQILAIESVLESDPKKAVSTVCETPLEGKKLGHDGDELLAIKERFRAHRSHGKEFDSLELEFYRQLCRFLELLINLDAHSGR